MVGEVTREFLAARFLRLRAALADYDFSAFLKIQGSLANRVSEFRFFCGTRGRRLTPDPTANNLRTPFLPRLARKSIASQKSGAAQGRSRRAAIVTPS